MNHAPAHWLATAGRGAKVVVLDTGLSVGDGGVYPQEIRHFSQAHPDPRHGSKVAQIIAGRHGIAPACQLFVGQIMGDITHSWRPLEEALRWAQSLRADVVNMSFACPISHPPIEGLLADLDAAGCICIASYNRYLHWPWSLPQVVAVGTAAQDDCDVVGPASFPVEVGNGAETFKGTSAAAAHVAAVAACAKASDPETNRGSFLRAILH